MAYLVSLISCQSLCVVFWQFQHYSVGFRFAVFLSIGERKTANLKPTGITLNRPKYGTQTRVTKVKQRSYNAYRAWGTCGSCARGSSAVGKRDGRDAFRPDRRFSVFFLIVYQNINCSIGVFIAGKMIRLP